MTTPEPVPTAARARREEIAGNLAQVRQRIDEACAQARRDPAEVTLIAVTKTRPAADVLHLAALGVTDVGENRDQEAAPKAAEVAAAGARLRWHFVGQLQRNKCKSVVGYADVVHSVDGVRLATTLARAADGAARQLDVLVQLNIDGAVGRGGALVGAAEPDRQLDRVAAAVAASGSLRLRGLMAVAPRDWPPERAFAELARVATTLRVNYPTATLISAGMSSDIEAAIGCGATHVRVGAALLGNRPTLR